MAVQLSDGSEFCFNAAIVTPAFVCQAAADLIFQDGLLKLPRFGIGWRAVSGPHGKGSLPVGRYTCTNYRYRTEAAMVREGVGFSVDLSPQFQTNRTLLRIHPDGNVPGTLGCIGITKDVAECADALRRLLPSADSVCELEVKL